MKENEAIEAMQFDLKVGGEIHSQVLRDAVDVAIQALEKVQQYRAIGTPEELQDMKSNYFEALSDWRQYRKIGTLEECRVAREKQIPMKPIFNHNLSDTLSVFHCECGNTIKVSHDVGIMNNNNAPNYCSKCGCRLDWSDDDEID